MSRHKAMLLVFSFLSVIFLSQPTKAYAWFFGFDWGGHHDRPVGYTEVVVGGNRYYYNEGVYYTGAPGAYVVAQAPVGALIYSTPPDFEQVNVDGVVYFRSHDIYYRPEGRGYRVVGRPHEGQHEHQGDHHG